MRRQERKRQRKAAAGSERHRRWLAWLQGPGKVLAEISLPDILIKDQDRWEDFVDHAGPHMYDPGPEFVWKVSDLSDEDAVRLLDFLEGYLDDFTKRTNYAQLYVYLRNRCERPMPYDEDDYRSYVYVWKSVLVTILGWSLPDAERWAEDTYSDLFRKSPAEFLSTRPVEYLLPRMAPRRQLLSDHGISMEGYGSMLEDAVAGPAGDYAYFDPNHDWQAARVRVELLLNRFGTSLMEVCREKGER